MALWKARTHARTQHTDTRHAAHACTRCHTLVDRLYAHVSLWRTVLQDWDDKTCEGTVNVDWHDKSVARGLDLALGRSIFPHANGQYADKGWQEAQARKHGHTDHPVVALADGHGIVIEGGNARVV